MYVAVLRYPGLGRALLLVFADPGLVNADVGSMKFSGRIVL